jgi:transcriptional regulator with PAS, ATPase and Fis domain
LVKHFIHKFDNMKSEEIHSISPEAMDILMSYDFPGNIRELENIIEYATLVCKNHLVGIEHLPESFLQESDRRMRPASGGIIANESSLDNLEKDFIYETLKKNNWKRKLTATQMGIHPTTLWRKMKRLNVQLPERFGHLIENDS